MKIKKRHLSPYWANRTINQISAFPRIGTVQRERDWTHLFAGKISLPGKELSMQNREEKFCWKNVAVEWARRYCRSTTLHGFKYLAEKGCYTAERFLWFIAVTAMFVGASYVVLDRTMKFIESPTLITFAHKQTSVNTLPFPAVTLCPHSQLKRSFYNMTHAMANRKNLTEEEEKFFNLIIDWCGMFRLTIPEEMHLFSAEEFHSISKVINGYESCLEFLPYLSWAGLHRVSACEVAQPISTDFGACFSFNMLPLDQILRNPNITLIRESWATKFLGRERVWSPDTGFTVPESRTPLLDRTPPWSPQDGGIFNFINILMTTNRSAYDPICSNGGQGFIGFVHNPAELPLTGQSIFYADEGKMLFLQVHPKIYTLDPRLEAWPAKERGCFKQDERTLSFFRVYTQRNCETECAANFSLAKCGCAAYYHPRLPDTPVCGLEKSWCFSFNVENAEDVSCDCMPACSDLEYTVMSSTAIRKDWSQHLVDFDHNPEEVAYSMLNIKFHGRFVQAIKRDVMFGGIDFIASAGGLLGLFLGFSLLSLVEFVFFITFKLWSLLKQRSWGN